MIELDTERRVWRIQCDHCGCMGLRSWPECNCAILTARNAGWRVLRAEGGWKVLCPRCGPTDRELLGVPSGITLLVPEKGGE